LYGRIGDRPTVHTAIIRNATETIRLARLAESTIIDGKKQKNGLE
jgi:hypothetical protein